VFLQEFITLTRSTIGVESTRTSQNISLRIFIRSPLVSKKPTHRGVKEAKASWCQISQIRGVANDPKRSKQIWSAVMINRVECDLYWDLTSSLT
jgi:hypothetical protein